MKCFVFIAAVLLSLCWLPVDNEADACGGSGGRGLSARRGQRVERRMERRQGRMEMRMMRRGGGW